MTVRLNPYIAFSDGNARAAMEFYHSILGGELVVNTFGDYGAPDAAIADKVMHSMLTTDDGLTLMGADSPPGMEHVPGNNITVSLSGDEGDRLRECWTRLSDGGDRLHPAREADVGRRVRHVQGQVRRRLDDQHRRTTGVMLERSSVSRSAVIGRGLFHVRDDHGDVVRRAGLVGELDQCSPHCWRSPYVRSAAAIASSST